MSAEPSAALVAGLLYLLSMAAGILSIAPNVDSEDYLTKVADNVAEVIRSAFAQLIMGVACVAVAIVLYPSLRTHGEGLALGFLGFRVIAGALLFVGVVPLVLLLPLSREYASSATPPSYLETLGVLLRTGRDLVNHGAMIAALSVGSVLLYSLLFQTGLIPRWLAGWGLLGSASAIVASLLIVFRLTEVRTAAYMILTLPLAAQELVFAIWLVARGFNPSVSASS